MGFADASNGAFHVAVLGDDNPVRPGLAAHDLVQQIDAAHVTYLDIRHNGVKAPLLGHSQGLGSAMGKFSRPLA